MTIVRAGSLIVGTGAAPVRDVTITLHDGRSIPVTVSARNTTADITWMILELTEADLPYAMLVGSASLIVDTRNALALFGFAAGGRHIVRL